MAPNGERKASSTSASAFFSNIPYTTTAGYLRKIFSKVGRVEEVELYTDVSGRSIGAGVVFFDSASAAGRAASELHDSEVDGRLMLVKLNERERRSRPGGGGGEGGGGNPDAIVFFNGVPYGTTEGYLRAKFERNGRIVDFDLWRRPDGTSQGMGTCEYSNAGEAECAIEELNNSIVDGRRMLVQMDNRPDGSGTGGAQEAPRRSGRPAKGDKGSGKGYGKDKGKGHPDRRVFWSNVPTTTTEGYLRSQFERLGTIVDFDFWRRTDGSSLGMGVCEFDHYLGAWRAHEQLHGRDIDGNRLLIKSDDGGKAGRGKGAGKKGW
mmetsp:Transcript_19639/g.40008  ORF Transcript_19639/g.40008 Transcript_19639/m.40008 type:complete len:321 (+) Transcript_19639:132-1094(+)